jgi:hypothetical protein
MTTVTKTTPARMRQQALVSTWLFTALILGGGAWTLGLHSPWWQRLLQALPVLALAALDHRGVQMVEQARIALTRVLAMLGWLQIPLAMSGGAWWLGQHQALATRLVLIAALAVVTFLARYAPSAPAPAGGHG